MLLSFECPGQDVVCPECGNRNPRVNYFANPPMIRCGDWKCDFRMDISPMMAMGISQNASLLATVTARVASDALAAQAVEQAAAQSSDPEAA